MNFLGIYSKDKFLKYIFYNRTALYRHCSAGVKEACTGENRAEGHDASTATTKKGIVLGVYEGSKEFVLTKTAEEFNGNADGKLSSRLHELRCYMKLGNASIFTDIVPGVTVALASLGPQDAGYDNVEQLDHARENVRIGVGAGVTRLKEEGCTDISVDPTEVPEAASEAAHLAAWKFEEFKSPGSKSPQVHVSPHGASSEQWDAGAILGECQNWARHLADMPANKMTPVDLAQAALDTLCPLGVHVEARDLDWIKAQNMQAFLTVAKGSCETPIFLECTYSNGSGAPILIAAKGVTFDSGGLCLKKPKFMEENRASMSGAAAVLAAMKATALFKLPLNVACVIPLCENMVSGQCMKVGDVVTALNGLSIQIENTDMEGRLMLADALVYGQHKHKPSLVIDVATFTHGILLAMGGGAFGCFSNSTEAWEKMMTAGAETGDRPWRFPLWKYYHNQLTNEPAVDLRNKGSGRAGPCLGAAFLENFICGPWLHLDITGVGKLGAGRGPPYLSSRRMTGRPARTLAHFLRLLSKEGNK